MTEANPQKHPLTLYNSLTRQKEPFIPQDPKRVTMYNCGPTVYSYAHIGNARAAVVADVLFRVLRHIYGADHVEYARNLTDIDDKIIKAATEQGVDISVITEKYAKIYQDDLKALNCLAPTHEPKATVHIPDMIVMISELIEKGHAYAADGHVFFDVSTYEAYGKLSGNTLDALRGGDRVDEGEVARKKNAADFVLWKPELDGVGWDAPFGRGRPGWHIECSAMAKATLTETLDTDVIDIHCGGVDLKFPHHENEIAQSCCANEEELFAKYWVHNEFLNMGSEKMSKSLGNVTLVHDLLEEWDGEVIRLALLKAHYRSELSWSEDLLKESKAQLDGWYRHKKILWQIADRAKFDIKAVESSYEIMEKTKVLTDDDGTILNPDENDKIYNLYIMKFLEEDLNLIGALGYVGRKIQSDTDFHVARLSKDYAGRKDFLMQAQARINWIGDTIGLLQKDPEEWVKGNASSDDQTEFDAIAKRREVARAAKDWAAADAARDEAKAKGIVLEDGPDGTSWRKA